MSECSALELFGPDFVALDGYDLLSFMVTSVRNESVLYIQGTNSQQMSL
jgi:hypothetical protein